MSKKSLEHLPSGDALFFHALAKECNGGGRVTVRQMEAMCKKHSGKFPIDVMVESGIVEDDTIKGTDPSLVIIDDPMICPHSSAPVLEKWDDEIEEPWRIGCDE